MRPARTKNEGDERRDWLVFGDDHNKIGAARRRLFLLLHGVRVEHGGERTAGASAAPVAVLPAAATVADHAADEVDGNGEDDGGILLGRDGAQGLEEIER